jgi:hypothetical protein
MRVESMPFADNDDIGPCLGGRDRGAESCGA